jgi:hypothetical protein
VSTATPVTLTASYSGVNATFGVTVNPALAVVASATYAGLDTTTLGTWTGRYGADGYLIAKDATNPPAYATVSMAGNALYTWAASTSTASALQLSSGSSARMASCYYASSFTVNVDLTDGNAHRIALYLLDWDSTARSETIAILDAVSNAVLYTGTFSGFHKGEYASWNVQGNVLIRVTKTGGANGVVSGIFFDPTAAQVTTPNVAGDTQAAATTAIEGAGLVVGTITTASSTTVAPGDVISQSPVAGTSLNVGWAVNLVVSASSVTYAGLDTTTQGTWTGKYGADGYIIANDATNPPTYATVSLTGDTLYTWAAPTTTVSALQASSGSSKRMASCYYSTTHFTINLNLTDGNAHQIALYLLDWSGTARSETISILDAVSNAVLYTGSFSSFHNGEYAVWNVQGHVLIQVTKTGGTNAVVSGIFFD